jgi:DNA-binding NarL/FixJ family response regulator
VSGYLLKDIKPRDLRDAIRLMAGEREVLVLALQAAV